MPAQSNRSRRQRLKNRLSRLKRANLGLRAKVERYRKVAIGSALAAVILALVLGFVTFSESDTAVPLGQGRAGVMTPEEVRVADSLRIADSLRAAEAESQAARGRDVGGGEASYYGAEFEGRPTASGEPFRGGNLTAAHRTLPFGSRVRVTNLRNGRSVVVRVNDRGPFAKHRVIDLSHAAAQRIGMLQSGTARVQLELLD